MSQLNESSSRVAAMVAARMKRQRCSHSAFTPAVRGYVVSEYVCTAHRLPTMTSLSILLLSLSYLIVGTAGHGYVESPRSRNFRAREEGKDWDHMSLNRKASANNKYGSGLCGVNAKNYDTFLDEWISEATYRAGDTIEITSHLTAYHGGHFEIGACADDEPTQECFSTNKLKYKGGGHPRDSAYKERAYLGTPSDGDNTYDGGNIYTHRFRLPDNIVGERVLLQWRYFTANVCQPEGYREYFDSVGWNYGSTHMCNKDTYDDRGSTVPERFW